MCPNLFFHIDFFCCYKLLTKKKLSFCSLLLLLLSLISHFPLSWFSSSAFGFFFLWFYFRKRRELRVKSFLDYIFLHAEIRSLLTFIHGQVSFLLSFYLYFYLSLLDLMKFHFLNIKKNFCNFWWTLKYAFRRFFS